MGFTAAQLRKLGVNVPKRTRCASVLLPLLPKVSDRINAVIVVVPIKALNTLNRREQWYVQSRRAREHRMRTVSTIREHGPIPPLPVRVRLTRNYKGCPCDDDGNIAALKHVRDGVADCFNLEDDDPRITFQCDQEHASEWSVTVYIETTGGAELNEWGSACWSCAMGPSKSSASQSPAPFPRITPETLTN